MLLPPNPIKAKRQNVQVKQEKIYLPPSLAGWQEKCFGLWFHACLKGNVMLEMMRKNANSWLMVLLFSIIIFVFAINFGPWAGRVGGGEAFAAWVNNKV